MEDIPPFDEKLYSGASISLRQFVLCIAALKIRLNLPNSHLLQILKLISIILPKPNRCPTSIYKFQKFFNDIEKNHIKKHFYCSDCITLVDNCENDINNDDVIEDDNSVKNIYECVCDKSVKKNYFLEVPIKFQLEHMLRRPGFFNKLNFECRKNNCEKIILKDIYDGIIYQNLLQNSSFLNKNNLTFMWYSDGVQVFKSSKFNIWGFF